MDVVSKCLGITIEENILNLCSTVKKQMLSNKSCSRYRRDWKFCVALDALNQVGSERGYSFKIGTLKKKKGEPVTEKTIICKLKDRNKEKHSQNLSITHKQDKKNS